ncbi:MAG: hypothetical protein K1X92_08940 [Bacteroidia bacterium]|nr:hypothetical protein [Bacteroidia bacterium]
MSEIKPPLISKEVAQRVMEIATKRVVNKIYITTDGNVFLEMSLAQDHETKLGGQRTPTERKPPETLSYAQVEEIATAEDGQEERGLEGKPEKKTSKNKKAKESEETETPVNPNVSETINEEETAKSVIPNVSETITKE